MLEVGQMTDNKKLSYVILLGGLTNVFCNVFYDIYQVPGVWYYGNSFAFVCYSYVLNKVINSFATLLIFALCFSQFIDEVLGSPTEINLIEYVSFLGMVIYLKLKKYKVWIT